MTQQSEGPRASALVGYAIAAIGLIIAIVLGWAMMAIGASRLNGAEKVRAEAESRLMAAVDFAAAGAMTQTQEARLEANRSNWGEAQARLSKVGELVTLMEQTAPARKRDAVTRVRSRLAEAQRFVSEQSKDVLPALDALVTDLADLRESKAAQ